MLGTFRDGRPGLTHLLRPPVYSLYRSSGQTNHPLCLITITITITIINMPVTHKRNVVPDSIREKIVDFVLHKGQTKAEVAKRLDYPWSTVDSIIRKYEDTGDSSAQKKKGGAFRGHRAQQHHLDVMLRYVSQHPGATIEEIRRHLQQETGLELSITSVQNALHDRCHLTLKRTGLQHDRHNSPETIAARREWVAAYRGQGLSLNDAVFLDEAGFHLQQTRKVGRAPVGQRAIQQNRPYNRGPNLSLLVAVDHNGIQAHHIKTGAWNADALLDFFLAYVLPKFEGQGKTFVLDNAPFHHSQRLIQTVHAQGHQIQYLPPYTPWFNIAKKVFAKVKPFVGRQELHEAEDIRSWIDASLATITPEMARGWIHETNRWMVVAEAGHPLSTDHDAETALRQHGLWHDPAPIDPALTA
ncbi:uncharacterized protein UTRI_00392 [Ustilago trichophora]|uniref:Tc1-like transposase DDE domain-containing protein n=1 Tax=Ustilago trichophora TaxID=86804 RepID=A0A5C3DRE6_9BASI|nr:uncharacterized protein UTRI_00392 [Ustilago trichophora]